ncbi:MAG TPA: glycerophosphodiester phosphodiesterase [Longimicrobiales bacterium]
MTMTRMHWALPLIGAGIGGAIGIALGRRRRAARRSLHPALAGGPLLIAHRGGAGLAPENTLEAFRQAVDDWAVDMIELDVRATADGHCAVLHDATVDRTTDGTGPLAGMTLAEVKRLDAGYRFTRDGGRTFPFRGRGIRIPTIEEVLEALPTTRLTIEVKDGAAQRPLFEAIGRAGAEDRIIVAGESNAARTEFGRYPGPTSASASDLRRLYILHRLHLGGLWVPDVDAAQMPEHWNGRRILTPAFVRELHALRIDVHVWTVNDPDDMHRLLDWGVDGLVTDRPDLLADILTARYGRALAPARQRTAHAGVE